MIIRLETPADYSEVESLTREAFWNVYRPGCTEHYVLNQYRSNPDFIPELDFVMEDNGRIIGHVMFSNAELVLSDRTHKPSWTFGPICIHPDYRRSGYGLELLQYALDKARGMGVGFLCMEGNIDFYKLAGFDLASKLNIHYHSEPVDAEVPYFLAQELIPGWLKANGITEATYCPPKGYFVADENPEAFEIYESTFPPKEKDFAPGQLPQFCQSCGMPLTRKEDCGTNADGSVNYDYCKYCYKDGKFLQECTMDEMIEHCAQFVDEVNKNMPEPMTRKQYVQMMRGFFPMLKRWRRSMLGLVYFISLMIGLSACQSQTEPCTVRGTIQGVNEGARITLKDAWNKYKDISTATVENGSFEFHSRISAPTYVYMYAENPKDVFGNLYDGGQLKDFILEPGTIIADVNAFDESDMFTGAKGTALNDAYWKIQAAEGDEREALWEEAMRDGQTNLLTLVYADSHSPSPARTLEILDSLSPELVKANKSFISRLKKRCIRRMKADERRDNSGQNTEEGIIVPQHYIDMEYPNPEGKPVSLRSVVENPANRYVILDFWATWCLPCVKSIPMLKEVYEHYHDKGLEIYSVSQDSKAGEWKSFVVENGMTWINVRSERGRVYKDYAIKLIPTVFLIDCKTGEILVRDGHPDLEAILSELLGSE